MKTIPLLLSAALTAALLTSCSNTSSADPASTPGVTAAASTAVVHKSGLVKLPVLKVLPTPQARNPTTGYPGKSFRAGVITDAATWSRVQKAAGLSMAKVDWKRQMVAYVILDAQTNSLGYAGWKVDANGRATMSFDWSGIEPFYRDATPGVFAIVNRASVKSVTFTSTIKNARPIGSVKL